MEKCFECGNPATENHHVLPKSLGGTKTVPLCSLCHMKIHGLDNTRRAESHVENTKRGLGEKNNLIKKQGYFISKRNGRKIERLGNPRLEDTSMKGCLASATVRRAAKLKDPYFRQTYELASLLAEKGMLKKDIAVRLNKSGYKTPRGYEFIGATVSRLLIEGKKAFGKKTGRDLFSG